LILRRRLIKLLFATLPAYQVLGVSSVFGNSNVTDDDHILAVLINTLRSLNNHVCEKAADKLEKRVHSFNSYTLHLRFGMLDSLDAKKISEALKSVHQNHNIRLTSFSVSYNPTLGQDGAKSILSSLPKNIGELGMVGCNLSDVTGSYIIEFIRKSKKLNMICIEENNFSQKMKDKILNLRQQKTGCTIIV
jgi:hypothetical protein